jgi:hypothetical protein
MSDLKMFHVSIDITVPAMIYATSKTQAYARIRDEHVRVHEATALEIADYVRKGLPIMGEPTPPDPAQQSLPQV